MSRTAVWDATAPTVAIAGVPAKISSTTQFTVTFTFSEAVTGFATGDVTVSGGTKGMLTGVSGTMYTLGVTPAGSADIVVTVTANSATDGINTGPPSAVSATAIWEDDTPTDVNENPEVSASCNPCAVLRGGEVRLKATATDLDGDPLSYVWSAPKGDFTGPADEPVARWTAPAELGTITIRVEVTDGRGGAASATVEIKVVNRAPEFGQSAYDFELPEKVSGRARPAVLGPVTASDLDGDAVTYELATGDQNRFAVGARDGVVRYVGPGEDFETEPNRFELTVHVSDEFGGEARTKVAIVVTDVNEAPEAADDEVSTPEDQAVDVHVLANDTDPEGDRLHVQSVTAAAYGAPRLARNRNLHAYSDDVDHPFRAKWATSVLSDCLS